MQLLAYGAIETYKIWSLPYELRVEIQNYYLNRWKLKMKDVCLEIRLLPPFGIEYLYAATRFEVNREIMDHRLHHT